MDANNNTERVAVQLLHHTTRSVNPLGGPLHNSCMATDKIGKELGRRIRKCRDLMDWTQRDLAVATGWTEDKPDSAQPKALSPSRIGNFEQGARRVGHEEAAILERVFQVPAAYFLGVLDERETSVVAALRGLQARIPIYATA